MSHEIYRVTSVQVVGTYQLHVGFDDGVSRTIDLSRVLRGQLYGPLRDPKLFDQVTIDPEVHTLVWPNGADFDPATLHDWPEVSSQFEAMALQWTDSTSASSRDAS